MSVASAKGHLGAADSAVRAKPFGDRDDEEVAEGVPEAKGRSAPQPLRGDRSLEDEWAEVAARTEEMRVKVSTDVGRVNDKEKEDIMSTPISYQEVQQWLFQLPVDPDALRPLRDEMISDGGCGCAPRRRSLCDVPGLHKRLWKDKDLVLFLKITDFDFNEAAHFRMLRTLYAKLTRNKVCPWIGCHWEVLGFQGTDPRTDLNRSGGVLNVMHLFYFFSHHFELMKQAFLLAQDDQQNFPLACVSIKITSMVVETFLAGRLSSLCNSAGERGAFETTCKVHAGGLFYFYWRWRSLKRTISDADQTFQEVRALMERKPGRLLDELAKGTVEQKAKNDPSRLEFTDLEFGGARAAPQGGARVAPPPKSTSPAATVPTRFRSYQDGPDTVAV